MADKLKGILVNVLANVNENHSDSKYRFALLVGEGIPPVFEESEDYIVVKLVRRNISGLGEYLHCEPVREGFTRKHYMFDGKFVHSSDSRFPSKYPIPLHDRTE